MKPRNFPGRKNDRRKGALSRLPRRPKTDREHTEVQTLLRRILPSEDARNIRTKKWRGDRAKIPH